MREINIEPNRSVERAIQILNCFHFERPALSIEDIVDKTGLPKATVYRLLWTMERNGLVHYDPKEGQYRLGYKIMEYGGIVLANLDIRRESEHDLIELHEKTGLTVILAVPQGDMIQYLARLDSDEYFQPRNYVGRRRVLHNGALGITMLAHMDPAFVDDLLARYPLEPLTPFTVTDPDEFRQLLRKIREDGHYVDADGTFVGFTAIAVPVLNGKGEAVAAVGLSGATHKVTGEEKDHYIRLLKQTASKIAQKLGLH
jgi:DNA-binding IclR family transcriptional regulator